MPELPEVETIRRKLAPDIVGKTIADVEVLERKQFIGNVKDLVSKKIADIDRHGKVLIFYLQPLHSSTPPNPSYLNFHLKMTGEILFAKDKNHAVYDNEIPRSKTNKLPNQHTRVIITFTDKSLLFFNDLRKFGWIKVAPHPEKPKGTDVLSNSFTLNVVEGLTRQTRKPIKLFLMDQDKLAGLGNIYANDILWQAKINPLKKTDLLTKSEIEKLYSSIQQIITEALKYHGSSASDEMYIMPDGRKGEYQHYAKVYDREGKACLRCKTKIKRIKQTGRSTYYCPKCQV